MIYLDYSATTPINAEVLDTYVKVSKEFIGNSNSLHSLGVKSKELEESSTKQIADLLGVKPKEIIYTSGASEGNNTVIKGICSLYKNRGNHIITTELEHESVLAPLAYLQKEGFKVSYVKLNKDGTVNLDNLKELLTDDTILVSLASVSSEVGILQPIGEIGKILKNYPKCFFHVDITQSVGKVNVDLTNVDLATLSSHKFYGPKGIGILIKKENINILPLIHGGKSTTSYRSGTPALPLIVATAKALRLALTDLDLKYNYVKELNSYLKAKLSNYPNVHINSTDASIPHILNFSITGIKSETFLHALESKEIYISTRSACSGHNHYSMAVKAITDDLELSNASMRISLSYLTTKEEIETFLKVFDEKIKELTLK